MAVGLLGTAASGLQVFQRAISVTGNNITNANTEGYSRQRVDLATRPSTFTGQGYIGNGVQIESVTRLFDQFTIDRLRATSSTSSQFETLFQYSKRVADLIGDSDAGLSAGLERFFNAMQDLANNPAAVPERQRVLSEAEALISRVQTLAAQLDSMRNEINGGLSALVEEINGLSAAIAKTNRDIVDATSLGAGRVPNDLLDKRDSLINRLSELVSVRTVEQEDGALNVFVGSGQPLVTRFLSSPLEVTRNGFDARRAEISMVIGGNAVEITDALTGGRLGALLEFRDSTLDPSDNALGRIAATLAVAMNQQQNRGMDLDGEMGVDMFSIPSPATAAHDNNTGTASIAASFDTAAMDALTTSDYVMAFDGTNWSLRRLSDNQLVTLSGAGTALSPFNADGLNLVVSGTAQAGDRFLVRPMRGVAAGMRSLIQDPGDIAAAAPVRVNEASNANGLPLNGGDARFELAAIDAGFSPLVAGISFTYDAAGQQFTYSGDAAGSIPYDPGTDQGTEFTVAGVRFRITGVPSDTDQFRLDPNGANSSDNFNALQMAGLQLARTMEGGTASFQDAYGQLVGELGTRTLGAEITADAQAALLAQAQQDRDALSGVNLDEEAADLIRFQQVYSAIAQVISVADTTFQTLLNAVGR
ncbi:MAG TPA: flagellar hook-associated protein FlgK [Gammaproteobacteria bacterium]|nr:flagellar hook-associated protein FlgK [Gammaproteobacteria bacterium]